MLQNDLHQLRNRMSRTVKTPLKSHPRQEIWQNLPLIRVFQLVSLLSNIFLGVLRDMLRKHQEVVLNSKLFGASNLLVRLLP